MGLVQYSRLTWQSECHRSIYLPFSCSSRCIMLLCGNFIRLRSHKTTFFCLAAGKSSCLRIFLCLTGSISIKMNGMLPGKGKKPVISDVPLGGGTNWLRESATTVSKNAARKILPWIILCHFPGAGKAIKAMWFPVVKPVITGRNI